MPRRGLVKSRQTLRKLYLRRRVQGRFVVVALLRAEPAFAVGECGGKPGEKETTAAS